MRSRAIKRSRKDAKWSGAEIFIFIAFCIVLAFPTVGLLSASATEGKTLLPVSLLALVAGLLVEFWRITGNWHTVLWTALGAYASSFLAFMPGKREQHYSFEDRIQFWPFAFCGIFIIAVVAQYKDRVTAQLHEGITLLQTLALVYFVVDADLFRSPGPWMLALLALLGLFTLFALLNAFLPLTLSAANRLWLSVWSCFITVFLAVDHIRRVFGLGLIEEARDPATIGIISLNYFLLGTAAIYMTQNMLMLVNFLPGKGTFFNRAYFREVRTLRNDHIERYTEEQLAPDVALLCLLFAGTIFGLNLYYQWVQSSFAIWAVFFAFPWFLGLTRLFRAR